MARKSSSGRWKQRQASDPYVRRARTEGWRSRAAFKLMEIDDRERLLRRGKRVLDLGAAPGGWSQVAAGRVGLSGRVIAVDLLPMEPLEGVVVIQGDFVEPGTQEQVLTALGGLRADLVISDMAPNITGNRSVDQPRALALVEAVFESADHFLEPGGAVLAKVFQGEGFEALVAAARRDFGSVRIRKPASSRAESREMYLVAGNYRL
ncbi:Ribosomal RNA large subunit methyltransferase E [Gammaproteobacteria bacterium]|nr:RlmE family RNA methyltransferase [Gammaproteobacteria bacterium]QOJ31643.1 MAG: RlmE family RNA methyltransferase [Gammaproteobacteria bacterium]CAG0942102.1 Ribosomal RNA large subunit methyltransferase E [Gammaproteobacteria bacterium]